MQILVCRNLSIISSRARCQRRHNLAILEKSFIEGRAKLSCAGQQEKVPESIPPFANWPGAALYPIARKRAVEPEPDRKGSGIILLSLRPSFSCTQRRNPFRLLAAYSVDHQSTHAAGRT